MFSLNDTMRYFLCPDQTDMRKGMHSLCGVVRAYLMQWRDLVVMVEGISEDSTRRLKRLKAMGISD